MPITPLDDMPGKPERRAVDDRIVVLNEIEANTRETADAIKDQAPAAATTTTVEGRVVAAPRTTEEDDRATAGQREINALWEHTQRTVALLVIGSACAVAAGLSAFGNDDAEVAAFVFLYGAANLVIGFYFGRTNHTRTGGVQR